MSALLCVPLSLGVLAGCGGGGDSGEVPTAQTNKADAADITYSGMTTVVNTDAYAVNALDKEVNYLLALDPDRLLYNFRENAGLDTQGAKRYTGTGNWEDSLIAGHTSGHYLSALAQAYANAGTSESQKSRLLSTINYLISELKQCQDATYGGGNTTGAKEGFLWGGNANNKTKVEFQFDNLEQGKSNINTEAWVPWYTMHKIIAGLIDVYEYTGNQDALTVACRLGDWTYERTMRWSEALRGTVITIEYGGMNDVLYNLYALTGEEKYAQAAHQFDEDIKAAFSPKSMVDAILDGANNYLYGKHANTTIPKVIGLLNGYIQTKGKNIEGVTVNTARRSPEMYIDVAEAFWERVVEKHTYVTGGNSENEHFVQDGRLNASRDHINCETCNTYNMLKLSRMLFTLTKDKKYLDFYENTYINAILSSQNPETGMTMYFQPMGSGYYKTYSTPTGDFWCCTGSGMESMTKLNDSIYYTADNATYVSLYMSSTYKTDKVSLTMTADLENSDTVTITVDDGSTILRLRRPDWTTKFALKVNENEIPVSASDEFASVEVSKGMTVTLTLGKQITMHNLPDAANVYAFKYGPYVLSAELGTSGWDSNAQKWTTSENQGMANATGKWTTSGTHGWGLSIEVPNKLSGLKEDYQISNNSMTDFRNNINTYMTRGADGKFTLTGITGGPLTYSIHYKQYTQRYSLYFKFTGEDGAPAPEEGYAETNVDNTIQPGIGQYELPGENFQDGSSTGGNGSGRYANAGGSFHYLVGVDKSKPTANYIVTNFEKSDNGKTIKMSVGGTVFFEKTLSYTGEDARYNVYIPIPESIVKGATDQTIGSSTMPRVWVKIESGKAGERSATLWNYFKTVTLAHNGDRDEAVAYFVDCGDYDTTTLSTGDKFGMYNSVTEQVYGADPITGRAWGIWDNSTTVTAPTAPPNGIGTNSTWAFETDATIKDGSAKTATNRYTKNQYENGIPRNLHYKFELPNGTYTVKMYFIDPWNVSKNPNVAANGTSKITNGAIGTELSFSVTVSNGELLLDITSSDLCINLCYIKILFA